MYDPRYLAQVRKGRAGERFGPDIREIAKVIFLEVTACPHVLEVLKRIEAEYPALSFSDFVDATRLANIIGQQRGTA
jgi:hypothetical protein